VQGTSVISLSGGAVAATTSCHFTIKVTGVSVGVQQNVTDNVNSTEGGTGDVATASISVDGPPSIAAGFSPNSIPQNTTTSLTFTITNPAANPDPLTGVGFSDTLPTGLTVATGSSPVCGGTLTTTAPTGIVLSGATINTNSQCQFNVTVTGAASGNYVNTTGNVTSTEGGTGNAASANLTVGGADISVTLQHVPDPAAIGGRLRFIATITNNGPSTADVNLTETLTGNLVVVSSTASNGTCGTGPITCSLPGMTNGEVRTVTVVVTPLLGRNISANVTVAPVAVTDPNNANNTANDTARIRFKPQRF
jgi:uncharacterized repeat protein (TIGR01451 family)